MPTVMVGGEVDGIPSEIREVMKVRWPRVNTVSNRLFQDVPLDKFYYSEKTDGLHANILVYQHHIYDITHTDNIKEITNDEDMLFDGSAILDTELYNDVYHIFDVYFLNGENLNSKFFLERMEAIKPELEYLGKRFTMKEFKPIPNIQFLIDFLKNDVSPTTKENIDGVILQRIDKPYIPPKNESTVYKMKPRCFITVDFLLKYDAEKELYNLYLIGSRYEYFNNLKFLPRRQHIIYDADGNQYERLKIEKTDMFPENLYILFDSPFIPNLNIYKNKTAWNKKGYPKRTVNEISKNIAQVSTIPDFYNEKIVEMSLTLDNEWVPLRIRTDKEKPNGYRIGLDNVSLIFDPIKPESEIYFQRDLKSKNELQDIIHEINGIYRRYVAETWVNPLGKYIAVLDIAGGRGGDELNLYMNGCSKFFVIDADTTALKQYVDRSYGLRKSSRYQPLTKGWKCPFGGQRPMMDLNVLHYRLDKDYSKIKADLESRFEWPGKVKLVFMNYAIHYLCDSELKIKRLAEFVKSILDKDGVFIFTYFDGDALYEQPKRGPFEIKIVSDKNNITIAKLPVPTFQSGDDIYREEPLVHARMINIINRTLALKSDTILYEKTSNWVDKLKDAKEILEYYKLIHVRVYGMK